MPTDLPIPHERLADFCKKWRITELALFGSAARGELTPKSDVDVLVTFEEVAPWSYFDMVTMRDELREMFGGREIDLLTRVSIESSRNPYRKAAILRAARTLYAA